MRKSSGLQWVCIKWESLVDCSEFLEKLVYYQIGSVSIYLF